jgi:hypothetical protein
MNVGLKGFSSSAVTLCLALAGCGGSDTSPGLNSEHTLSGLALADAPVSAVSLRDSSAPPQERTITADSEGAFSFDVTGLTPPYILEAVDAAGTSQSALASRAGVTNINALTTAAKASASRDDKASASRDDGDNRPSASGNVNWDSDRYESVLKDLRTVLAPLFDNYGVKKFGDDVAESRAFRAMLKEVSFTVASGTLTVTNKATGAVIYSAPLSDVASGVLHPENIPGGTVTPPGSCTYTYAAWGACQSNNTQTRVVASSTPAGCTGTPVLSQSCVFTVPVTTCTSFTYTAFAPAVCPASGTQTRTVATSLPSGCSGGAAPVLTQTCTGPVLDGAALYTQYCSGCHGPTGKKGRPASAIQGAITNNTGGMGFLSTLTAAQIQAISSAP